MLASSEGFIAVQATAQLRSHVLLMCGFCITSIAQCPPPFCAGALQRRLAARQGAGADEFLAQGVLHYDSLHFVDLDMRSSTRAVLL